MSDQPPTDEEMDALYAEIVTAEQALQAAKTTGDEALIASRQQALQDARVRFGQRHDQRPPPWYGHEQVPDAPYPMTLDEYMAWLKTHREPGYKYELHAGMATRLKRGPEVQRIIDKLAGALGDYAEEHGGVVIVNQEPHPKVKKAIKRAIEEYKDDLDYLKDK